MQVSLVLNLLEHFGLAYKYFGQEWLKIITDVLLKY